MQLILSSCVISLMTSPTILPPSWLETSCQTWSSPSFSSKTISCHYSESPAHLTPAVAVTLCHWTYWVPISSRVDHINVMASYLGFSSLICGPSLPSCRNHPPKIQIVLLLLVSAFHHCPWGQNTSQTP